MLIEFPYIAILYLFLSQVRESLSGILGDTVTILGTSIILLFAIFVFRDIMLGSKSNRNNALNRIKMARHPIIIGILLSGLNIWFLIWWLSIGFGLITLVAEMGMGIATIFIMFLSHIWIDFLWLMLIAEASKKGFSVIGSKEYNIIMIFLGIMLIFFGINISLKRFLSISLLP